MLYSRRSFLKVSGGLTTGMAIGSLTGTSLFSCGGDKKLDTFGIQLWTIREDMAKDPKDTLKQLASFGYKQIESFEGDKGIHWGMTNVEFRDFLDQLGMKVVSSHCDIEKDFEKKASQAAEIGMKYLISPWIGPQKTLDEFKRFADKFNQKGEICRKNGIRFAYHNHDYTFQKLEGEYPQDVLMKNTDPALVDYEMDIYWVVTAREDAESWLKKYEDRFKLCHVKDRMKASTETHASCILGEGSIDYASVLKTAKKNGMEYFIVEQERYDGTTPMKAAAADAGYMKNLRI